MGLLIVILIILAAYLFIKNLPVIALSLVGGVIILLVSNYVIKDMIHIDADKYVDTQKIEDLEDKVLLKSDEKIAREKIEEYEYENGMFSTKSATYMACVNANLEKMQQETEEELPDCNVVDDSLKIQNDKRIVTKENTEKPEIAKTTKELTENGNRTYTYKFSKYKSDESRLTLLEKHSTIEDKRFSQKLLGLSPYVTVEYDLGNAYLIVKDEKTFEIIYK